MKRLKQLSFAILLTAICCGNILGQDAAAQEQAWQTGLSYVNAKTSLTLPANWVLDNRVPTIGLVAKQHQGMNGKIMLYNRNHGPDAEAAAIAKSLSASGEILRDGKSVTGNAGEIHRHFWFAKSGDSVNYHLVYFRVFPKQIAVFRGVWPVPDTQKPDGFAADSGITIDSEIKPTIDAFYGDYVKPEDGLVYNGSIGVNTEGGPGAKVSFKLPTGYLYANCNATDVQRWTSGNKAITLRVLSGVESLKYFKDKYPRYLHKMAAKQGVSVTKDAKEPVPGFMVAYRDNYDTPTTAPAHWTYAYFVNIPQAKDPEKVTTHFQFERFYEGSSGSIVVLSFRAPIVERDFKKSNYEALALVKGIEGTFKSLKVQALGK